VGWRTAARTQTQFSANRRLGFIPNTAVERVVAVGTANHEGVTERKKNRRLGFIPNTAVDRVVAVDTANHVGEIERKTAVTVDP
jgi:hypothetical protein